MKKIIAIVLSLVFALLVAVIVTSCNGEANVTTEQSSIETTSHDGTESGKVTYETVSVETTTDKPVDEGFDIQDGILVSYTGTGTEITIPDGVKIIESFAFKDMDAITSVVVPKSVTTIRPYAFTGCNALRSIVFEESSGWGITLIEGEDAFKIDVSSPVSNALSARGSYSRFYWVCSVEEETTTGDDIETTVVTTETETTEPVEQYELVYLDANYSDYDQILMGMRGSEVKELMSGNPYTEEDGKWVYYTINKGEINSEYGTLTIHFESAKVSQVEYIYGKKIEYVKGTPNYYIINPGITEIGKGAFKTYYSLMSVTIPDTVTRIGEEAFSGLNSLGAVVIGDGVESIGKDAFRGCDGLRAVYIYDVNFWCGIEFENLFSNPLGYAHNLYINSNLVSQISILSPVTSISDFAFFGCYSITDVTINSLVTKIGQSAFFGCKNLKNVTFRTQSGWRIASTTAYDDGVTVDTTDAGQSAIFLSTAYMSYYWYNNGERDTTQRMKNDFSEYTAISIGDTLDDVVNLVDSESYVYAIGNNSYIWYSEGYYEGDRYNVMIVGFNDNKVISVMFVREGELVYYNTSAPKITIPSYVKAIGPNVFANNKSLVEITLHDNTAVIGEGAFRNCTNLTTIHFGSGLEKIGDFAFEKCTSLAKMDLPERLEEIGRGAFSGTESLYWADFENINGWYATTVKGAASDNASSVPVNVSYQGIVAGSLNNIYVNYYWYCSTPVIGHITDDYTGYKDIEVGMTLNEVNSLIGYYSDRYSSGIGYWYTKDYEAMSTENTMLIVTFKNELVSEVSFVHKGVLVYWDGNVTTVNVTNRATSIADNVFSGYDNIQSVIIPSSITKIGNKAFYRCTGLVSVTFGSNVSKIDQNAFGGCTSLATVTFNNPNGWHVTTSAQYSGGIPVDVSMASLNAFYLSSEYIQYYWYRN